MFYFRKVIQYDDNIKISKASEPITISWQGVQRGQLWALSFSFWTSEEARESLSLTNFL